MNKSLLKSLAFILIYYLGVFVIGAIDYHTYYNLHLVNNLNQAVTLARWVFIISPFIVSIIGIILFKSRFKQSFKDYKQHFFKYLCLVIIGFGAILIISSFFTANTANQNTLINVFNSFTPVQTLAFTFIVVIFGPINEEIIFRQILIGELSAYFPKWLLLILSSLAFGVLHVPSLNLIHQALVYILNGLIIGLVYLKTNKNIIASSSIHWINNLLSLISI